MYWRPYVPVAQRQLRAKRKASKMRKAGIDVLPVEVEGRKIAKTFWGKAWCDHLEKYSDYRTRLPRGRTYVRNGSVFHLALAKGKATAQVSGSEIYSVDVKIKPIPKARWSEIADNCAGGIGSLVDLLQGHLSTSVMSIVTDRDSGMFPSPDEISFKCSCLDWAYMCKHVAAVLYGIGARLDSAPETLFLLRGVKPEALIQAATDQVGPRPVHEGDATIAGADLSAVFGVEIDTGPAALPLPPVEKPQRTSSSAGRNKPSATGRKAKSMRQRTAAKPISARKPVVGDSGPKPRGLRCYEDREKGFPWAEINRRQGYKSNSGACVAARNYALRNGLTWPIPLDPA